jgi:hypothetical protein
MRRLPLTLLAVLTSLAVLVLPTPLRAASTESAAAEITAPHGVWVAQTGADRVRWAWSSVPGATRYRIAVSTSATMSNPKIRFVEGRWATFAGLRPGQVYYASVRTLVGIEFSRPSVKVPGIPGAVAKPLGDAIENADAVAWRWAPYVGAAKYQVWSATSRTGANAKTQVVTGRTVDIDVERDSHGYLKVRALNSSGSPISAWSPIGTAYVPYHPV